MGKFLYRKKIDAFRQDDRLTTGCGPASGAAAKLEGTTTTQTREELNRDFGLRWQAGATPLDRAVYLPLSWIFSCSFELQLRALQPSFARYPKIK
jgi:hypothetical protein